MCHGTCQAAGSAPCRSTALRSLQAAHGDVAGLLCTTLRCYQQSSSCFSLHMGHSLLFAGHTVPNASAQRAACFPAYVGCRGRLPGLQAAGVASKRLELQQGFPYASRNHFFVLVAAA